jgi:hypothetical protein
MRLIHVRVTKRRRIGAEKLVTVNITDKISRNGLCNEEQVTLRY